MTEGEYLENQCQLAKARMRFALRELKHDAMRSTDPRLWARVYPWATVAAAAMAGFAATRVVESNSKPEEQTSTHAPAAEHRPGRIARVISAAVKIWSLAGPLVKAAVVAHMERQQSTEREPASAV